MDRPSTIMLCKMVPGIGFKVIRVFSASATNSGSLSAFRKAASTARTRSRHAGRHGVGTRVTIRVLAWGNDQA